MCYTLLLLVEATGIGFTIQLHFFPLVPYVLTIIDKCQAIVVSCSSAPICRPGYIRLLSSYHHHHKKKIQFDLFLYLLLYKTIYNIDFCEAGTNWISQEAKGVKTRSEDLGKVKMVRILRALLMKATTIWTGKKNTGHV